MPASLEFCVRFVLTGTCLVCLIPISAQWLSGTDVNPAIQLAVGAEQESSSSVSRCGGPKTIRNLIRVGDQIISGSAISGIEDLRWLQAQGVTTIVSVDGRPPLREAETLGLRRVHIPTGYDKVDRNAQLSLFRVASGSEGRIYVHCHHGVHRGPAAAAIIARALGTLDESNAKQLLEIAGTGRDYPGLWQSVAEFQAPTDSESLPELMAEQELPPLVDSMVSIDQSFEWISRSIERTSAAGSTEQELERRLSELRQLFREAGRFSGEDERSSALLTETFAEAESRVRALQSATMKGTPDNVQEALLRVREQCTQCHAAFRDVKLP